MNIPLYENNPGGLAAFTDAPKTRWVSPVPEHVHRPSGAAYLKAQAHRFSPGQEMDAWLSVMAEITQQAEE